MLAIIAIVPVAIITAAFIWYDHNAERWPKSTHKGHNDER